MTLMTRITGFCPMGCGQTLRLAARAPQPTPAGLSVICGNTECPNPWALAAVLGERETDHLVDFTETSFALTHPLRDRVELDRLVDCPVHEWISELGGPPVPPGRYRALPDGAGGWTFEAIT